MIALILASDSAVCDNEEMEAIIPTSASLTRYKDEAANSFTVKSYFLALGLECRLEGFLTSITVESLSLSLTLCYRLARRQFLLATMVGSSLESRLLPAHRFPTCLVSLSL